MEDKRIQSLINDNWDRMLSVLDKEMPLKRKKNRRVLFMWIGAAASFIILTFLFFLILNKNIVIPNNKENHVSAKLPKSTLKNNMAANINKDIYSSLVPEKDSVHAFDKNKSAKYQSSTKVQSELPILIGKSSLQLFNTHAEDSILISDLVVKNNSIDLANEKRNLLTTTALPENRHFIKHDNKIGVKDVDYINTYSKWHFGVDANLLTHNYKDILSSSFGFIIDKNINDNWKLTSGLRWSRIYYSSAFISRNDVLIVSNQDKNLELSDNSIKVELEEKEASLLRQTLINNVTKNLDYAEFSLGLAYRVHRRIYITSSILAGYNIKTNYKESQIADNLVRNYSMDNISQSKLDDIGSLHEKFIFNIRMGTDFRLYNGLFISTNAHIFTRNRIILSDVLAPETSSVVMQNYTGVNSKNNDYQIGLEIGMKYYFN